MQSPDQKVVSKAVPMLRCPSLGCGATFTKEGRLKEHVSRHTGQRPWLCNRPGCGKAYAHRGHLEVHKKKHLEVKAHRCSTANCRAAFKSKKVLKRHLMYKHGGAGPLKCSVSGCKKTFHKKSLLKVHLSEHSGEPMFVCDFPECPLKFKTAANLTAHRRRHAGYRCPYEGCQIVAPTWSSLQKHRKKHPVECKCTTCGKLFKKPSALRRHRATHRKPAPRLACPRQDCPETFATLFNLTHHVRKSHLCLQTHRCYHAGCNRVFSMRESLIRHLVVHDPDRKKLKLKFKTEPSKVRRHGPRTLPVVEQDLSRLFSQKMLFRFKTQMESNLSGLFNERLIRDPAEPEFNLSGLFNVPVSRAKNEKVV
ncbi:P43 5S RNA-binding protein-like [Discoglossus pictus]